LDFYNIEYNIPDTCIIEKGGKYTEIILKLFSNYMIQKQKLHKIMILQVLLCEDDHEYAEQAKELLTSLVIFNFPQPEIDIKYSLDKA